MSENKRVEQEMAIICPCCAGLDVHKKTVVACVRRMGKEGMVTKETREFSTTTQAILAMGDWFACEGVTHVVMESTGVFWKPIWNLLEERFTQMLCNARHVKQVPGRKTSNGFSVAHRLKNLVGLNGALGDGVGQRVGEAFGLGGL